MKSEHDDDLTSTVDVRDELETDDYPKTDDDLEEEAEDTGDDRDDDYVVGK